MITIQKDKIKHFLGSFILTFLVALYYRLEYAIAIVFIVGLIKELYDYFIKYRDDCLDDIIANCCGIILAVIILWR